MKNLRLNSLSTCIPALGTASALLYVVGFRPDSNAGIRTFLLKFLVLSILYLAGAYLVVKKKSETPHGTAVVVMILLFGVLFRAALVPAQPMLSSDIYRYIWDGRVQAAGINPYLYPPSAKEIEFLRDDRIYPELNRRDHPTIYPGGAQVFFRFVRMAGGDSVRGFKGWMVFFDALTMLIILKLIRLYRLEGARVLIYAWNPLVIVEIAHSGHLEGLTIFFVVASLYLNQAGKKTAGVAALALAAATKLYPALILPALLDKGKRVKGVAVFFIFFLALYLPYVSAADRLAGFLPLYLKNPYESFNLGLKYFFLTLFPGMDYYLLTKIFLAVLAGAALVVFLREKTLPQVLRHSYILAGLMIVLAPASLHPWYVIWLIPFLVLYPAAAWLLFSCMVALSYLKYVQPDGVMPRWVLYIEYLPLFALLAGGRLLKGRRDRGLCAGGKAAVIRKETFAPFR